MARVLLYGGALFVALLLQGAQFLWRHAADANPGIADADLEVETAATSAEPNGFPHLERAAKALAWPEQDPAWVKACIDGETCPEPDAGNLVAANERALALLEPVLTASSFRSPPMRTVVDELPNMLRWLNLGKILALRANARSRSGEPGALEAALAAIQLGQTVQEDRSAVLVHAMIGLNIKAVGLRALTAVLPRIEPTPEESLRVVRALEALRTDPAAWRAMWAFEYRVIKRSTGSFDPLETLDENGDSKARWLLGWAPEEYSYQSNVTWSLYADRIRTIRTIADRPCSEIPPYSAHLASPFRRLLLAARPNGVGLLLLERGTERLWSYERRRCASDSRIGAAQILVALRAHEVEVGALPSRLEALVPRFLDAVPVDAFARAQFEYLRESRRLAWQEVDSPPSLRGAPRPERRRAELRF